MRRVVPIVVLAAACAGMWFLPGPRKLANEGGATSRADVVEVDDSGLQVHGLVEFGTQRLKVRLPDGSVKTAHNELRAQMELDKKFYITLNTLVTDSQMPDVIKLLQQLD